MSMSMHSKAPAASESRRRLAACTGALLDQQPFFGSLALRLDVRADPTRRTIATDGRVVLYNPEWISRSSADTIRSALARIVTACALKHHTRRGARNARRWQAASQLVTHGIVRDAGFLLPPGAEAWDDTSVEEAYERLPAEDDTGNAGDVGDASGQAGADDPEEPPGSGDDTAGDTTDSNGGEGDDTADQPEHTGADTAGESDDGADADQGGENGAGAARDGTENDGDGDGGDDQKDGQPGGGGTDPDETGDDDRTSAGHSGTGAAGAGHSQAGDGAGTQAGSQGRAGHAPDPPAPAGQRDEERDEGGGDTDQTERQASHDPNGTGEVLDAPLAGNDPADARALEEQIWDEATHQAVNIATSEGHVPAALVTKLRASHRPLLDYKARIRRFMQDAMPNGYSWTPPNPRFVEMGLYLPSLRGRGLRYMVFLIDTSASCDQRALNLCWSEIRHASRNIQPDLVDVIHVDAELQHIDSYRAGRLPETIEARGGGGTDFRPGFEWLAKQTRQPRVALYFTDMECTQWPRRPGFPVLWINHGQDPPLPMFRERWGTRVDLRLQRYRLNAA